MKRTEYLELMIRHYRAQITRYEELTRDLRCAIKYDLEPQLFEIFQQLRWGNKEADYVVTPDEWSILE